MACLDLADRVIECAGSVRYLRDNFARLPALGLQVHSAGKYITAQNCIIWLFAAYSFRWYCQAISEITIYHQLPRFYFNISSDSCWVCRCRRSYYLFTFDEYFHISFIVMRRLYAYIIVSLSIFIDGSTTRPFARRPCRIWFDAMPA